MALVAPLGGARSRSVSWWCTFTPSLLLLALAVRAEGAEPSTWPFELTSQYSTCPRSGVTLCPCTTGCGANPGTTVPCACSVGTQCDLSFSGCTCCELEKCNALPSATICKCATGCGSSGQSCACSAGTNCNLPFSGCVCCDDVGGGQWPAFTSSSALDRDTDHWGSYYKLVYGELPPDGDAYPLNVGDNWVFYQTALTSAKVKNLPSSNGNCPSSGSAEYERYDVNNYYQADDLTFSWHAYPYKPSRPNTWVEVMRQEDPFGDEKVGAWFLRMPGSGLYLNTGITISFNDHGEAYNFFGIAADNELLCATAAANGYDSIEFVHWIDHVNYPCDTANTGRPALETMGVEIVATRLVGTYACGDANGAPDTIRRGWQASQPCKCDNSYQFLNCDGVPRMTSREAPRLPFVRPAHTADELPTAHGWRTAQRTTRAASWLAERRSSWAPITTTPVSLPRWGHTLSALNVASPTACGGGGGGGGGTFLYAYGGFASTEEEGACEPRGTMHVLCAEGGNLTWHTLNGSAGGASPPPRAYHAAAATNDAIFISGGRTLGCGALGDLWRFDGANGTWSLLSGAARVATSALMQPPAVYGHSLSVVDGLLLQLGGSSDGSFAQLAFDYSGKHGFPSEWRELSPDGASPTERRFHVGCVYHDQTGQGYVLLHGGLGSAGSVLDELWRLDPSGKARWAQMNQTAGAPAAVYAHTCAMITSQEFHTTALVISGGLLLDGSPSNRSTELDLTTFEWVPSGASGPAARAWAAAAALEHPEPSAFFELGGAANRSEDIVLGELWEYSRAGEPVAVLSSI